MTTPPPPPPIPAILKLVGAQKMNYPFEVTCNNKHIGSITI